MELYTAGTGNGQRAAIAVNECGEAGLSLRTLCRLAGNSENADNRANAIMMAAVFDSLWRTPKSLDLLYALLCREPKYEVVRTATIWLEKTASRMECRHINAASIAIRTD